MFCRICYTKPGEPKLCPACYKRVEESLFVEEEREKIYNHIVLEEARNAPYDTDWKQGYLAGIDDIAKSIKDQSELDQPTSNKE